MSRENAQSKPPLDPSKIHSMKFVLERDDFYYQFKSEIWCGDLNVGVCHFSIIEIIDPRSNEVLLNVSVSWIAISPKYKKHGYALSALLAIMKFGVTLGCETLSLEEHQNARGYYAKAFERAALDFEVHDSFHRVYFNSSNLNRDLFKNVFDLSSDVKASQSRNMKKLTGEYLKKSRLPSVENEGEEKQAGKLISENPNKLMPAPKRGSNVAPTQTPVNTANCPS